MKNAILALLAVGLFAGSFTFVYRLGIEVHDKLPMNSLVCASPKALTEAKEAVSAKDQMWVDSIDACFTSTFVMDAKALDCGWDNCRVRLRFPTGEGQTVYVSRGRLAS